MPFINMLGILAKVVLGLGYVKDFRFQRCGMVCCKDLIRKHPLLAQ